MTDDGPSARSLFDRKRRRRGGGIRVIVTGQVGLDKKPFLEQVVDLATTDGHKVQLINVGDRMYAEGPDIVPGRILDLPKQRLTTLRRSVFKDILAIAATGTNLIVNTHATFRWKHGLFHAYDHAQMVELDADLYITLIDNVDAVHERLEREHETQHNLRDILVWREEEIVVTEAMAVAIAGYGHAYVMSTSNPGLAAQSLYRLMFEPQRKRVYPSFPMTHVIDMPQILAEIERFRDALAEHFITFDPADFDEKRLLHEAGETHHRVFRIVDGADDDWASWYSDWLINLSELPALLSANPARSELTYLLVSLDKDYTASQPGEPWETYYAQRIFDHFHSPGTLNP